ncbi:MAG: hypothetical protein KAG61_06610 [Bacteriovoracaceae bacterium]|nr:hypothetical protein [Bacteriovoracaceae bacterium]
MSLIDDPAMKEIIVDFCIESEELFDQLQACLEELEVDSTNTVHLEMFGQVIDRVMGAAKSIGATEIANFCELGKIIGYKSSQTSEEALLNIVVAVLFDTVDLLRKMLSELKTGNGQTIGKLSTDAFATRLRWLSDKFKFIERGSCAIEKKEKSEDRMNQGSIDDLLDSLGL